MQQELIDFSPSERPNKAGRVDSAQPSLCEKSASHSHSLKEATSNDGDLRSTSTKLVARSLAKSSIPASVEHEMPPLLLPQQQPQTRPDENHSLNLESLANAHFMAFQMPGKNPTVKGVEWSVKLALKQIHILHKAFPAVQDGSSLLAMCAWFHLFCFFDDETEKMSTQEGQRAISHCITILRTSFPPQRSFSRVLHPWQTVKLHRSLFLASRQPCGSKIAGATYLFTRHVAQLLPPAVYRKAVDQIVKVFTAYSDEFDVRAGLDSLSIDGYMASRTATIGLAPFWEIMLDYFLEKDSTASDLQALEDTKATLEPHIATVVGLQNDMVGLAKDMAAGDRMNYVVLLADRQSMTTEQALEKAISLHNTSVQAAVQGRQAAEEKLQNLGTPRSENVFGDSMLGFMETHLAWASGDKRYKAT